jgi:integrase
MTTLEEAIDHYSKLYMGGYSATTWKAHRSTLRRFKVAAQTELGPRCLLTDVTPEIVGDYLDRFRPPRCSGSTFNNYRTFLRQFFDYCRDEAWITKHPMRHARPARVRRRLRLQLTASECRHIIDTAQPRDRIALALGVNTALRSGDLTALRVGDVNLDEGYIRAQIAKTGDEDRIPITANLDRELRRWFAHYAVAMGDHAVRPEWRLVPVKHWQAANVWHPRAGGAVVYLTHRQYRHPEQIVHRALERLGYATKGEGFHTLRRTAARLALQMAAREGHGNSIRVAQQLLGHQNQTTTERYVGHIPERVERDRLMRGREFLID